MIIFKEIRYQNILSVGNDFITIKLNRSKTTLIKGPNGSGKTTLIVALIFALYGKTYINVNKNQLVNSITSKNLLVELDFSIGSNDYMVRRGIKPNIFEIYQNGSLINQSADIKEYQDLLEKSIVKINYKSFIQIVVLGSTNYIPFMELSAADRRSVVEDLLTIQIFSIMNSILKTRIDMNKSETKDIEQAIALLDQEINLNETHIRAMKAYDQEIIETKETLKDSLIDKIEDLRSESLDLQEEIEALELSISDESKMNDKKSKIIDYESKIESKIKSLNKEIKFYEDNEHCPVCSQSIDKDFKEDKIKCKNDSHLSMKDALSKLQDQFSALDSRLSEIRKINTLISSKLSESRSITSNINSYLSSIESIENEIKKLKDVKPSNVSTTDIENLRAKLSILNKKKYDLVAQKEIYDVSSSLLKDGGIKTRVIRQYVPIINKLVNKYLSELDFYVQFELDEKFNETIKSRYRDEFSYSSFSEGQKARINTAIMFAWRDLARIRNSASTNLLIMDEITDSSLDDQGTEDFLRIIDNMSSETNIFIISHHGDRLEDKFHSKIEFKLVKNFTKIV